LDLSRRARAVDQLLYDINRGFWRWVAGGRGEILGISVGVIASARPPSQRLLRLGQPKSRPLLICPDSEALIEYHSIHFCFLWRGLLNLRKVFGELGSSRKVFEPLSSYSCINLDIS
jgi:hypothetical protein